MLTSRLGVFARNLSKSAVSSSSHLNGGVPGENLPFNIHGKYRLTLLFALFFGSATAIPFLMLRSQLLKN